MPPGQIMKTALVVLDKLLEEEETQVHGVTLFENLDGFSLAQAIHLARSDHIRKGLIMELLQVCESGARKEECYDFDLEFNSDTLDL